jgi:hypothetical protein
MKTLIVSALAIFLTVSFTSCEEVEAILPDLPPSDGSYSGDNNDSNNGNNTYQLTPADLEANLISKDWKIDLFIEDFDSETNDFAGYSFTFSDNGSVTAIMGNTTRTGTWGAFTDDGKTELWMSFPNSGGYFYELTDDWYLKTNQSSEIRLEGSNPQKDILVFVPA